MDMNRQVHASNVGLRDIKRRKILKRKLGGIHYSPRFTHGTKTHIRTGRIFKICSKLFQYGVYLRKVLCKK